MENTFVEFELTDDQLVTVNGATGDNNGNNNSNYQSAFAAFANSSSVKNVWNSKVDVDQKNTIQQYQYAFWEY